MLLINNKFKATEYFTFTGIWIYFIILNSASSQLPNYVFSIVPLMAVLTAKWINISVKEKVKLYKIFFGTQLFMTVFTWISIVLIAIYLFPFPPVYYWLLAVLGIMFSVFIYFRKNKSYLKLLAPSIIAFVCLIFLLNTHVYRYIFSFQAPPKAARYFTKNASAGDKLYNYKYGQYELFFYSEPQAIQLHNSSEMKSVTGKEGSWIFTNEEGFAEIEKLQQKPDTIIEYRHLYLNRGGRFINPKNRNDVLQNMYLLKY